MWTNVFKIGGLHQISWFQFLPLEPNVTPLPDTSLRFDERDTSTLQVISSHVQLQKEGFLSAWTNSFVGPWDPSQGSHNPDKKIKLWLFLPGRHASVIDTAQAAVSRLRIVASGFWIAPGDSEEIATALSQALRNKLERAFMVHSYVRFGDVFTRCSQFPRGEELFRKGQPAIEFVFAATEEALFVHVIISAKLVRTVAAADVQRLSKLSTNSSRGRLPAIVSPHGMRGRLTGCSPGDFVKQVYDGSDMLRTSSRIVGIGRQNGYVEVALGCNTSSGVGMKLSSSLNKNIRNNPTCSPSIGGGVLRGSGDEHPVLEKTFIYPMEAILVPVLQLSYARSSLKRLWLQNWMGPSFPSSTIFMHCIAGEMESLHSSWMDSSDICGENSSSNSNNSSISSVSSGSSDGDHKMDTNASDLEADADSLTCGRSGLSSINQMDANGSKQGAKRPRPVMQDSFDQTGARVNASGQDAYKSDFNSLAITGLGNDQMLSNWCWDDNDDKGMGMDIQALLSEFGEFGEFFENDVLPFGEPPGTAESEAMMFPVTDCEDLGGTSAAPVIDVSDQMILPAGFPTFESFGQLPTVTEECPNTAQEAIRNASSSAPLSSVHAVTSTEFDHVLKAEALITFASEYGAVETPPSEVSSTIFRSPYRPKSRTTETVGSSGNSSTYGATPPASPCFHVSNERPGKLLDSRSCAGKCDAGTVNKMQLYTHVHGCKDSAGRKPVAYNDTTASCEMGASSLYSSFGSSGALKSVQKSSEVNFAAEHLLLSPKIVTASELECLFFQASMCRIRHTLLSLTNSASDVLNWTTGSTLLSNVDPSTMTDDLSAKYEVKRRESIPVIIAGDIDDEMLEGTHQGHHTPVGVWRSVGSPKGSKPTSAPPTEVFTSCFNNAFSEGKNISYGQRQPLQDFLDGIALIVQQAASFVDVALDAECGDGPYGWLALQEQRRRGFCCGPHMVHAGCGGVLASSHSLDIAGVELVDPLSADVHASSVISLLHSDVKAVLKSAFASLDGPLCVTDWCKGWSQSGDGRSMSDGFSSESTLSECRDSSSNVMGSLGDPVSPLQSSASVSSTYKGSTSVSDGVRGDDTSQRRSNRELFTPESDSQLGLRHKPRLYVVPYPSLLVGYQDDWLKVSASSLQLWEKAPLEPYAFKKNMAYYVVCPNIDPLTSAAEDFFQQLGTVYETCKLGTHSPEILGNQLGSNSGKLSSSGFVLLDCPQSMKIETSSASLVGSISDYFLSLSNGWDITSFLKSLTKVLKSLKLGSSATTNAKEGNSSPSTVIYIVCPFPDQTAILQTVVEACVAVGSVIYSADSDRRSMLYSQVGKALSSSAGIDEASASNILRLSGFSIPKLVLQIVTVDTIFRVTSPTLNELVILKEIAFTVYSKARRISQRLSNDLVHSSSLLGRSHSVAIQMANSVPGMWKECVTSRISGPISRENEMDTGLQASSWNNTWQPSRSGGSSIDGNRMSDFFLQEEMRYMYEPLFILAEPGSLEHAVSSLTGNLELDSSKQVSDDFGTGGFHQNSTSTDMGTGSQLEGSESESFGLAHRKSLPSLHCCYGWTEDWRWMVCVWTDSRGELLDSHIFPFGGVSSRQDTKGIQSLFVQVLQQGCQILQASAAPDNGAVRPRDFVITHIGSFYELEYQEWQKALLTIGGSELKKWPVQLRRAAPDGLSTGGSVQQQDIERSLPNSPSPMYTPHTKSSGFTRGALGQPSGRLIGGSQVDSSRGLLQWVQSISFVSVSVDHSLHFVLQEESLPGGSQGSNPVGSRTYLEGYTPVKSLGSTPASYIFVPSASMRFLTPSPFQLPTCLTSESPPLAHLLHSRGTAIPISTGFVVSKSVPSLQKNGGRNYKEEWPSILSVSLVDYYGGYNVYSEKLGKGVSKPSGRASVSESREHEAGETHTVLESVAAELHALSWMTASPAYLDRRTALPFHCDTVLRLRRLLHFADKHLSREPEKLSG